MKFSKQIFIFFTFCIVGFFVYNILSDLQLFMKFEYNNSKLEPLELSMLATMEHYSRERTIFSALLKVIGIIVTFFFLFRTNVIDFIAYNSFIVPLIFKVYLLEAANFFRGHGEYAFVDNINIIIIVVIVLNYFVIATIFRRKEIVLKGKDFFWQILGILGYVTVEQFFMNWY